MYPYTVRLTPENQEYLRECAEESETSVNVVMNTLIDACRRRSWRITKPTAQIREPE